MARQAKKRGARSAAVAEAKVFMTGRSQAVRLPKEYRVAGDSVYVKRLGNGILLLPKTGDRWAGLFAALDQFPGTSHFPTTGVGKSALDSKSFSMRKRTSPRVPTRYHGLD